jgi:Xaa-Pro aminopeptidase
MQEIGKDSIALILSNSPRVRSYDEDFKFTQDKNFYYLTGFTEPNSALLLVPAGMTIYDKETKKDKVVNEVLFLPERNPFHEAWDGKRLGKERVKQELGVEYALANTDLPDYVGYSIKNKYRNFYVNIVEAYDASDEMKEYLTPIISSLRVNASNMQITDPSYILGKMRSVKTPYEIAEIQKAVDITRDSLLETMRNIRAGLYEYQVQAVLEFNYKYRGSEEPAFPTIVASGGNACTLHYITNREKLEEGKLLLIDTGAESNYYGSDITRTYPINGRFSKEQREIYNMVLKANKLCIRKVKAGLKLNVLKKFAEKVLADELIKAGIIKREHEVKKYYIHGIGHHLGLDTHDAVPYSIGSNFDNNTLKAGNVLTIEPGLYFPEDDRNVPKKYRGIGVRIEDDILVTRNGAKNLSEDIIKEAEDIEEFMAGEYE